MALLKGQFHAAVAAKEINTEQNRLEDQQIRGAKTVTHPLTSQLRPSSQAQPSPQRHLGGVNSWWDGDHHPSATLDSPVAMTQGEN